jgi:ribulose-phosphate 3-epimerase
MLAADFAYLGKALEQCREGGADYVHVDVMDGHFVPNLTLGPPVVADMKRHTTLPLDVHLMIENPERYVDRFAAAGAHIVTVHVEACAAPDQTLRRIRDAGVRVGISLRPSTVLKTVEPFLEMVDLVLVMSVEPGFGGQTFIPDALDRIRTLDHRLRDRGIRAGVEIEVDGGITLENAADVIAAGADVLVAGTAIFGADDPVTVMKQFKRLSM